MMKILKEEKIITVTYHHLVLDDGFVFPDIWELIDLLDELDDCDGLFNSLIIDSTTGKKLEELGVAFSNVRGSYGKGANLEKFYMEVAKLTEEL